MSTWREIWKKSIIANSLMSRNEEQGKQQFYNLLREYKIAQKLFPVEHWKAVAQKSIERLYEKRGIPETSARSRQMSTAD